MGIKHINFLFLCLFSLEFFSLTKVDLTDVPKSEEEEVIGKAKILKDSIVFIDKENEFNFSGFKQKGVFKFVEDINDLDSNNLFFQNFSFDPDGADQNYKVVQFPDNSYGITDGALIIFFQDNVDRVIFASNYELILIDNYSFGASFKSNNYSEFESLIEEIENDVRVKKIEFNLMLDNKIN